MIDITRENNWSSRHDLIGLPFTSSNRPNKSTEETNPKPLLDIRQTSPHNNTDMEACKSYQKSKIVNN